MRVLTSTLLAAALIAAPAGAGVIYESASLGSPSSTNKGDISGAQSWGVRFQLTSTMVSTAIGGHLLHPFGGQGIYAAVVSLSGPTDYPNSINLTTSDVLGSAILSPLTKPSSEVSAPLSLVLTPGWYALVYGSGSLGASGTGGIVEVDSDIGSPDYFRQTHGTWAETFPANDQRFFLVGVPEPSTLWLIGGGVAALAGLRRRSGPAKGVA